jgi:hypothetical protein
MNWLDRQLIKAFSTRLFSENKDVIDDALK